MNFFKTGLQSVLGTSENSQVLSGAETASIESYQFFKFYVSLALNNDHLG